MNRQECDGLIDSYIKWLREGLSVSTLKEACELTTPFLDRHNDHLQIYATRRNGEIILSDDGYILSDLRTSGLGQLSHKRQAIIQTILQGFGVKLDQNQLVVEASQKNIGQKLHSLIQAMLAVNDMFVMAQPHVATFFWEDVRGYLDEIGARYSPRVKVSGRTGFDHNIDFLIPKSPARPERFVQAINAPNKNTITTYLFALSDTREGRGKESEAYAFLNDQEREIGGDIFEALQAYEVKPAPWSKRHEVARLLSD